MNQSLRNTSVRRGQRDRLEVAASSGKQVQAYPLIRSDIADNPLPSTDLASHRSRENEFRWHTKRRLSRWYGTGCKRSQQAPEMAATTPAGGSHSASWQSPDKQGGSARGLVR